MGYVTVAIALFCLTVKGYCGKKTSVYMRDTGDAYLFNLTRLLFCVFIGAVLIFFEGAYKNLLVEWKMLAICALSGAANAAFLVGWLLAIRKNAMVSVDVSLTLGSLLPSALCFVFFDRDISMPKMVGFAFILVATVILAGYSKRTVGSSISGFTLLVFAAVGDGLSGFAQQLYKEFYTGIEGKYSTGIIYPNSVFQFYTYIFASAALLAVFGVYWIGNVKKEKRTGGAAKKSKYLYMPKNVLLHIFVMAVCLFAANYLQTAAATVYGIDSQVLYPIVKGGCLITVNLVAMIFFNEKMTWRSVVGSLTALAGIVIMSIL